MKSSFLNSLPIVAQALGEKLGVRVVIGGNVAKTDGDIIYIPTLPDDDEQAVILARGFIDHESAHVRDSDFEVWPREEKLASLTNVIEDIRIEKNASERYPGTKKNLSALAAEVVKLGGFPPLPEDAHPFLVLHDHLLYRLRHEVLGQEALKEVAEQSREIFDKTFSRGLRAKIEWLLTDVPTLASTAETLMKLIREDSEEKPDTEEEQPQGGNAEAGDQGEDQSESLEGGQSGTGDEGSGNEDDENATGADSDTTEDRGAGEENSGGGTTQQDAEGEGSDLDKSDEGEEGDAGQSSSSEGQGDGDRDSPAPAADDDDAADGKADATSGDGSQTAAQKIVTDDLPEGLKSDLGDVVGELLQQKSEDGQRLGKTMIRLPRVTPPITSHRQVRQAEVARQTTALRTKLASRLQAQRMVRSAPKRVGRRLDRRLLHRVAVGDTRIFQANRPRKMPNTAIQIVLDQSHSMHTQNRFVLATQACLATALAAQGIPKVEVAIAGFSSDGNGTPQVMPLKHFGQRIDDSQFYALYLMSTPLAEALWWGGYQLATRRNVERRILLSITDGEPDDLDSAQYAVQRLRDSDIEVLALGIQQQIPFGLAERSVTVNTVDDIAKQLFALLEERLTAVAA